MKSIDEKAEEYAYANWQSDEYHDGASEGLPFDAIGHTQKTWKAGANYVLEQIEKKLPLNDKCLNDYGKALVLRLKDCIEQLKK